MPGIWRCPMSGFVMSNRHRAGVTVTATSEGKTATVTRVVVIKYRSISAGTMHVCDIASGGIVWCWGLNGADWQVKAGLSESELRLYRQDQAETVQASEFDGPVNVTGAGGYSLYKAYVGRVILSAPGSIPVFVDDSPISSSQGSTTWFDGVGFATVSVPEPGLALSLVSVTFGAIRRQRRRRIARNS